MRQDLERQDFERRGRSATSLIAAGLLAALAACAGGDFSVEDGVPRYSGGPGPGDAVALGATVGTLGLDDHCLTLVDDRGGVTFLAIPNDWVLAAQADPVVLQTWDGEFAIGDLVGVGGEATARWPVQPRGCPAAGGPDTLRVYGITAWD